MNTPLLFEVGLLNYRDLFLWLVRHGADLLQRDSGGATIWEFLAERKRNKFIAFLKSHPEMS